MPALPFDRVYLTLALLVVGTVVGMILAARYRRDVADLAPTTAKEVLDPLEDAYYSGLMHPDEIVRIRESIKKTRLLEDKLVRGRTRPTSQNSSDAIGLNLLVDGDSSGCDGSHAPGDGASGCEGH